MIFLSKKVKQTQKIAGDLARKVYGSKKPVVITLEGELGAGKTTFIQGFAKALGVRAKIKSPTFVLMKKYIIPGGTLNLYHLDCYRLRDEKDLAPLEIKNILKEPHNIVLIEWAERVKKIIPQKHIKIHIDHIDKNIRKLLITNY